MHPPAPWSLPEAELVSALRSAPGGLSQSEAEGRLRLDGPNELGEEPKVSKLARIAAQFQSPMVLTLLGACALAALLGELVDSIAIGTILVINAIIGYLQETKAEEAVAALKRLAAPHARVLRDGAVRDVASAAVCRGDVLILEAGDFVPADARVLQASQASANEAPLTGESLPVQKTPGVVHAQAMLGDRANMVFAGTALTTGSMRALVTATAMHTEIGKIAALLGGKEQLATPLQKRMGAVSNRLLVFTAGVTVLVALLGLYHRQPWLAVLMTSVSLAVAAIPEGLPTVVTLTLALAVRRMAGRNAIVRHLPAVETLGTADVICTDKTGTLTTGQMQVRDVYWRETTSPLEAPRLRAGEAGEFWEAAALCCNASLGEGNQATGDPTEVAILRAAVDRGLDLAATHRAHRRLYEWPFDSDRKRMSVAAAFPDGVHILVKGAPEAVLPLCAMDAASRGRVDEALETLSSQGRRVLAVATRTLAQAEAEPLFADAAVEQVERELRFLGLVAIADPPRPEAMRAIQECKAAGIRVVMITGDHPVTAKAIATELGIVEPGDFEGVITGEELEAMSDLELKNNVLHTAVYARVSPEHKLRIVRAWKADGLVVAMTGDGVNDAPGLKEASIGVAMGQGGTEVARQAASMVLADDNFATIVSAIKEGRGVHGNIQRTISYLLAGNMAEILVMLGAALVGLPAPLLPLHLLWINLVTDGVPTLALAAEPVPADALKYKPSNALGLAFYRKIIWVGAMESALVLGAYSWTLTHSDEVSARSVAFTLLVLSELFRSFTSRSDRLTFLAMGPRGNLYHLAAVLLPLGLQGLIHAWAPAREIFRVRALSMEEFGVLMLIALIPATAIELRKLWIFKLRPAMHR